MTAENTINNFLLSHDKSYEPLLYYAAIPLVLTPEILHYLRHHFTPRVPWIAESDILLRDDICRVRAFEQYTMRTEIREYLLAKAKKRKDIKLTEAAQVLVHYLRILERNKDYLSEKDFQAQAWSAMVFLDENRGDVAAQIAAQITSLQNAGGEDDARWKAEVARLQKLTASLAAELPDYPALMDQARELSEMLAAEAPVPGINIEEESAQRDRRDDVNVSQVPDIPAYEEDLEEGLGAAIDDNDFESLREQYKERQAYYRELLEKAAQSASEKARVDFEETAAEVKQEFEEIGKLLSRFGQAPEDDSARKVYLCYAREDEVAASQIQKAYRALGNEMVLRDVSSSALRGGEPQLEQIQRQIEEADVFLLFWSTAAANSQSVRFEWEYALSLDRESFVRPMYWEDPMPPVPEELAHLHFEYFENKQLPSIYISYRRQESASFAQALFQSLTDRGYDVFLDYESIAPGDDFSKLIEGQVRARDALLMVLAPGSGNNLKKRDDLMRLEAELALQNNKTIIPILHGGFEFRADWPELKGPLANVPKLNSLSIQNEYFEEGIKRLVDRFLQPRASKDISEPTATQASPKSTIGERPPSLRFLVDRKEEVAYFLRMIQFEGPERVLNLIGESGLGKTMLLKSFLEICRFREQPISAVLVNFAQEITSSKLDLINLMMDHLVEVGVDFPNVESRLDNIKKSGGTKNIPIGEPNIKIENIYNINLNESPFEQGQIDLIFIRAFIEDLKLFLSKAPLVLMFDTYERASYEMRDFLFDNLIHQLIFNETEPSRLLFVLSGQETLDYQERWKDSEAKGIVRNIQLQGFTKMDIREMLDKRKLSVDESLLEFLSSTSKGNPLYLSQLIERMAYDQQQSENKRTEKKKNIKRRK